MFEYRPTRVVLVRMTEEYRGVTVEAYDAEIEVARIALMRASRPVIGQPPQPTFQGEVANDLEALSERLRAEAVDRIVFFSSSMISVAREIKKQHRKVEIFVLAGEMPAGEVAIVPKRASTHESLERMLH